MAAEPPKGGGRPRRRWGAGALLAVLAGFAVAGETAAARKAAQEKRGAEQQAKQAQARRTGILAFVAFLACTLLVVAAGIWAVGWDSVLADRQNPETEDAYADGDFTSLSARVAGYVSRVLVNDNEQVRAGDVLVEIEDDNYRVAVRQAEAAVDAAKANVASFAAREAMLRQQIAEADNVTQASRAQHTFAAAEAARQRAILATDLGLLRTAQQADAQNRATAAATRRDDSLTEERRRQFALLLAQEARAQAQVGVLGAELELARINLGYTRIRAPRDGVVGPRQVRVGEVVSVGQEVISIAPLSNIWVTANFDERQITHIRIGQPVRLRFDAYPDTALLGRVVGLSPLTGQQLSAVPPDNTTGNYTKVIQRVPVKVEIDNQPGSPVYGLIRPGLSVLARVQTRGEAGVRTAR